VVNADGSTAHPGFSAQHQPGTGNYFVIFPDGTFSGSEGKFLLATVTPLGTNTFVKSMGSVSAITSTGSGLFQVRFDAPEVQFSFVVAVQIE